MAMLEEEEPAGIPEWVVTFGDMMSLLLTFFIMLVSMSEIKEDKLYQAMVDALRKRFGHEATMASLIPGNLKPRNSALAKLAAMGRARRKDTMNGGDKVKAPVGDYAQKQRIDKGDQVTCGSDIVFKEGSAELTEHHKRNLEATAQEIGGKPQKIEIRGHTSPRPLPPDGPYKTHWDLAYARCRNVKDYLLTLGIDPKRLRLTAAADNEPKDLDDPLLREENPRVEIFMLNELVQDLPGTAEEKQRRFFNEGAP